MGRGIFLGLKVLRGPFRGGNGSKTETAAPRGETAV